MNRWSVPILAVLCTLAMPIPASAQWETASRAFHKDTAFPLDGRHLTVACASCHLNGVTKGTPTTCASCHWERRQDDVYRTRLGTACEQCHRTSTWSAVRWDHAAATGVPLNPAHKTVGCVGCHKGGQFTSTPTACVDCHRRDFEATTAPNHLASGFSTVCESCHRATDVTFSQARFDHNAEFPLVGTHATATCASCHVNGRYAGTPRDCLGCHRTDYERAQTPNHVSAGFSTACDSCHRPTDPAWRGASASFNHAEVFALVGQHAVQNCVACHANGVYKGIARDCVGCHRTAYERTTSPSHTAAGFSTACDSCHRPTDPTWGSGSATFNHSQYFALVGTHATQACTACHSSGAYKGTPRDCVGCHQADYERTQNPSHAAAGYSTTCDSCHRATDATWQAARIDHNQYFPLVGRHSMTNCSSCHTGGAYKGTPRECFPCHQSQYERTTAPNHAAAGYSTACEACHRASDSSWQGARVDHSQFFPLAGRHSTTACTSCHVGGTYKGTPRDCVGCHRTEYERTTAPSHAAARFPTSCEVCHRDSDATWTQGRFTHSWFPITSGRHSGNPCSACHQNASNYTEFTCLTCHTRGETDSEHRGRNGYRYDSIACYGCHPQGRSD